MVMLTMSGFESRKAIRALLVLHWQTGEKSFVTRVWRIGLVSSFSDSVWRKARPAATSRAATRAAGAYLATARPIVGGRAGILHE